MSIIHYISANKELQIGQFGSIKKCHDRIEVDSLCLNDFVFNRELDEIAPPKYNYHYVEKYDSYVDAAGIYVYNIDAHMEKVKSKFKNSYVYVISPNIGKFIISKELMERDEMIYVINKKCINELFAYIQRNISDTEEFEIYSCYLGEEGKEKNHKLDTIIDLNSFKLGDDFCLSENQYILVKDTKDRNIYIKTK